MSAPELQPVPFDGWDVAVGEADAPMTEAEARACIAGVRAHVRNAYEALLEFREREGYLALGYSEFGEAVVKEVGDVLGIRSRDRAYKMLQAARVALNLQAAGAGGEIATGNTEQLRALRELPAAAQVEVAKRIDFQETPAAKVQEVATQAKAAIEAYAPAEPDWDAVVQHVESDPEVLDARLKHSYTRAVNQITNGLLDLDPALCAGLLTNTDGGTPESPPSTRRAQSHRRTPAEESATGHTPRTASAPSRLA